VLSRRTRTITHVASVDHTCLKFAIQTLTHSFTFFYCTLQGLVLRADAPYRRNYLRRRFHFRVGGDGALSFHQCRCRCNWWRQTEGAKSDGASRRRYGKVRTSFCFFCCFFVFCCGHTIHNNTHIHSHSRAQQSCNFGRQRRVCVCVCALTYLREIPFFSFNSAAILVVSVVFAFSLVAIAVTLVRMKRRER
jgi:hypothetical protein